MTTLREHKPKLGGRVRQDSRPMTALVAIFDNAWTMQQAIERLVARGYDEAVYDEAIISENTGEISVSQAKRGSGTGKTEFTSEAQKKRSHQCLQGSPGRLPTL